MLNELDPKAKTMMRKGQQMLEWNPDFDSLDGNSLTCTRDELTSLGAKVEDQLIESKRLREVSDFKVKYKKIYDK